LAIYDGVLTELCRKMHEDDPDATAEDCETELSIIWSAFFLSLWGLSDVYILVFTV